MENCEPVKKAIAAGNCLFGTVDTWLIWVCILCVCSAHVCVCVCVFNCGALCKVLILLDYFTDPLLY